MHPRRRKPSWGVSCARQHVLDTTCFGKTVLLTGYDASRRCDAKRRVRWPAILCTLRWPRLIAIAAAVAVADIEPDCFRDCQLLGRCDRWRHGLVGHSGQQGSCACAQQRAPLGTGLRSPRSPQGSMSGPELGLQQPRAPHGRGCLAAEGCWLEARARLASRGPSATLKAQSLHALMALAGYVSGSCNSCCVKSGSETQN